VQRCKVGLRLRKNEEARPRAEQSLAGWKKLPNGNRVDAGTAQGVNADRAEVPRDPEDVGLEAWPPVGGTQPDWT